MLYCRNVPFDKDELNAILKFGTEDLFKEDDKEEDKALKVRQCMCILSFNSAFMHVSMHPPSVI